MVVQLGRLQSVCQIFYSVIFSLVYTSIVFSEMQHALRLAIIYHAVGQNTRTKIQKDMFFIKNAAWRRLCRNELFKILFRGVD